MALKTHIGWRNRISAAAQLSISGAGASVVPTLPLANLLTPQLAEVCRVNCSVAGLVLTYIRAGTDTLPRKGMVALMGIKHLDPSTSIQLGFRVRLYSGAGGTGLLATSPVYALNVGIWQTNFIWPYDLGGAGAFPVRADIELYDMNFVGSYHLDMGYAYAGDDWSPEDQSSDGWQDQPFDNSQVEETPSGQFFPSRRSTGRVVRLRWDALSGLDVYGQDYPVVPGVSRESYLDLVLAFAGVSRPVIAVPFDDAATTARPWSRPVYGRFVDLQAPTKIHGDIFALSC